MSAVISVLAGQSKDALALQTDHGLAAEASVAKLVEDLARAVQVRGRANAGGNGAVPEHARYLGQSVRRQQGIRT